MKDAKNGYGILAPKLPRVLDIEDIDGYTIESEDICRLKKFCDCTIENAAAEKVTFEQVVFSGVIFSQVSLASAELTDVRFENCDLSNADLSRAVIYRTEFINCKLMGINLGEATLRDVVFDACNGSYSNFKLSDCKQLCFRGCVLQNADFMEARFAKVYLERCNMRQAQLCGVKLKGMDLSDCDIEGIGIRLEDLNGVKVSALQAVELSKLLGIIIKE